MLRWAIDKILFATGFVAGGVLPGFLIQYRQRVGGRLEQAQRDLAYFQETANRHFNGDLNALIQHHSNSVDAAFQSEGAAVSQMAADVQNLSQAYAALDTGVFGQIANFLPHMDAEILRATWQDFVPTFAFTVEGLVLALACGVLLSGLVGLPLYAMRRRRLAQRRYA